MTDHLMISAGVVATLLLSRILDFIVCITSGGIVQNQT